MCSIGLSDMIKDNGVCVYEYGLHVCLDYYYLKEDDCFYHVDGDRCERLKYYNGSHGKFVKAKDYHTGEDVQIYYDKFKKDNAWIWLE